MLKFKNKTVIINEFNLVEGELQEYCDKLETFKMKMENLGPQYGKCIVAI